jgi:predicted GIY-YIG superfamily endonuclease
MKLTDKFNKLAGIYIIKNLINGKIYVGETLNIHKRMCEHRTKKKNGYLIHKAFTKYGIDKFEVYVEYFPNFSKTDLWDIEEQLILKFDSITPNGYNICSRGEGPTGLKHSEKSKEQMSRNSYNKGKFGKMSRLSKKVYVYTIDGNFIKEYIGYTEAARNLNTTHGVISNIISGKLQQVKGYIFKDKFLGNKIESLQNNKKRLRRRKVGEYDIYGNLIREYSSVSEASKLTGIQRCIITKKCKNEIEWKYMN